MALRWEQRSLDRWIGFEGERQLGYVGQVVSHGGARHYWLAWRQYGSAQGVVVGRFDTAEEAMWAVDREPPANQA